MHDWWMENAYEPGRHILLDLGYAKDQDARDRSDRVFEFLGNRRNFGIIGFGRIVCRVPPTKLDKLLTRFPDIKPASEAPGYSWCTHTWLTDQVKRGEMSNGS